MNRGAVVDRTDPRVETCAAECRECDWTAGGAHQGYGNIQKRVRLHVATHGHRVVLRKQCVTVYRPKATP